MRAFTFAPDQIVVNQGDTVTLHFLGVQGPHHVITVEGVGTFPLDRGQIHTVTFTADKPGTITYWCHYILRTWLARYWYFLNQHSRW